MPNGVFNLWDQAEITELTNRAVDRVLGNQRERVAGRFAPLRDTRSDKIGREQIKVRAVGKGRIIADDATPPIWRPTLRFVQEAWELVRLSEMTPVEESLRRQLELNGTDQESVDRRKRAGADILTRFRSLAVRLENQSDWMVMQSILYGELPIQVANPPEASADTEFVIDYEYPPGHLGQVTTSFSDLTNSNPITVFRAIQEQLKASSGDWGTDFYFSSEVWQLILNSKQVKDSLTGSVTEQAIPREEHVKNLLYEPQRVEFHIMDEGWYEEAAGYDIELDINKTRWLPKDRLLVTSSSRRDADPLASMYDGMVPVQTDWNNYEYRGPGMQTYVQLIQGNLTLMGRVEARRIPMVHHPENIVSYKVVL